MNKSHQSHSDYIVDIINMPHDPQLTSGCVYLNTLQSWVDAPNTYVLFVMPVDVVQRFHSEIDWKGRFGIIFQEEYRLVPIADAKPSLLSIWNSTTDWNNLFVVITIVRTSEQEIRALTSEELVQIGSKAVDIAELLPTLPPDAINVDIIPVLEANRISRIATKAWDGALWISIEHRVSIVSGTLD